MREVILGIAAIAAAFAAAIALIYILLITPSMRHHKTLKSFSSVLFAHRGLYSRENGIPENSLAAFSAAANAGFGMELDVRLSADGRLFVIHDNNTLRMTGTELLVSKSTASQLRALRLSGTDEHIPELHEVLSLIDGRVPLIIELKIQDGNCSELGKSVFSLLDSYNGEFAVESFDPRMVMWLRHHRPQVARGQLIMYFHKHGDSVIPRALDFITHNLLFNVCARPDFIAMYYHDRDSRPLKRCRRLGAAEIDWTVQNQEQLDICLSDGVCSAIFEGFIPKNNKAIPHNSGHGICA